MTGPAEVAQDVQPGEPAVTGSGFLYQFFLQAPAPGTWTADAA